jgi:hypothetical protein
MFDMMTQMCAGGGWLIGIFAVVVLIVLILAAAALVKYLLTDIGRGSA